MFIFSNFADVSVLTATRDYADHWGQSSGKSRHLSFISASHSMLAVL
jgi:hypothetical protein